jgi:OFA family oxalate/formate antiporter-like MFS transporter
MGVIAGIGCGRLHRSGEYAGQWFPDRRGMATGMAIMGFGRLRCGPVNAVFIGAWALPTPCSPWARFTSL